ncbi:MAG: TonB-dependent receptor, partial [Bacteroidota bacterium]|nr:TonB-dependent receptor [Bacteroidota bacterium]
LKSTGTGYNYGLEITLEKFFSNHYFFMYTASFFQSKYKAADGIWRSTAYDVNYVMNLLGGKEFVIGKKKNNIIGLDIKLIWKGGSKYTPIDLPASIASNETIYATDQSFTQKLPDYFRIDFGTYFRRNKKQYSWVLSFDAQNVINRLNVADKIYDPVTQTIKTEKNLGIVPVMSWKIDFGIGRKG